MEDRRIFERFGAGLPLKYVDLLRAREGYAELIDACAKGASFVSDQALKEHTPLEMWFEIPDQCEPLHIRGEVAWSRPITSSEYKIGVNLETVDLMGIARILRAKRNWDKALS
jgi:hypothetical protein